MMLSSPSPSDSSVKPLENMFSRFEWLMALRYLRARRQEGFISVIALFSLLGIMIGVATLIIVPAVMNGFRAELLDRILGVNGHILVRAQTGPLVNYDELKGRLKDVDGVVRIAPIIEGQVMATAQGHASGALVRGIRQQDLRANPLISDKIYEGSLQDFKGKNGVVVGYRLAQQLGLRVGDRIRLIAPQVRATVIGTVPRQRAYQIVATFDVGMIEYDSTFIFMNLEAAQIFFGVRQAVSALEVVTVDPEEIDRVRVGLMNAAETPLRLVDWRQINSHFFTAIEVERNVMFLILTLIVLVAAFNIVSSLIMLVKEKSRAIAIMRTMGATRGMIMRIFFIAGASIGVVGTIMGFLLGLGFADNIEWIRRQIEGLSGTELFAAEIYFLSRLPAKVEAYDVMMVVALSFVLSFLATLYPSWRAARLDPVDALRYE